MIECIVVGVDGSECALEAAKFAAEIASRFAAKMVLTFVVTPVLVFPEAGSAAAEIIEGGLSAGEEIVAAVKKALDRPGLRIRTSVEFGSAAEMLSDVAIAENADLVVVGSRGRGAVARVLLGSVADRLSHICKRPVLIFHGP